MKTKFLIAIAICFAGLFQVALAQTKGNQMKMNIEQNKVRALIEPYCAAQSAERVTPTSTI